MNSLRSPVAERPTSWSPPGRLRHANEAIRALEAFVLAADGCERKGRGSGYAIHGIAGSFVVKLAGSYTNVVGLPLTEVVSLLQGEGFPVSHLWLSKAEVEGE